MKKIILSLSAFVLAIVPQVLAAQEVMEIRDVANFNSDMGGVFGGVIAGTLGLGIFIWLAIIALFVISLWKIFTKAGQPVWAAIIPIYNIFILLRILNRPWWWLLLMFIPFVNIIVSIIVVNDLAKAFGKGVGYTIGLLFLGIIFYPMLAFGDAVYTRPVRETAL